MNSPRWTRTPVRHPGWCGGGHVCSADRPAGEHRSTPLTLDTETARLVITRIQTRAGADRIELRAVIDLPADPHRAEAVARRTVATIHQAVAGVGGAR